MSTKKSTKAAGFPAQLEALGSAASKQVREAIEFIAEPPRKAVGELQADLTKRGKALRKRADKTLRELKGNVEKGRKDLTKRAQKAVQETLDRAEAVARDLRRQLEAAVSPVASRLDVASRSDVDTLRKRLDRIERRMSELAAVPPPAPHAERVAH